MSIMQSLNIELCIYFWCYLFQTTTETLNTTAVVTEMSTAVLGTTDAVAATTMEVQMEELPKVATAEFVADKLVASNNTLDEIIKDMKQVGESILHSLNVSAVVQDSKSRDLPVEDDLHHGLFCDSRQLIIWVVLLVVCMILPGKNRV